MLGNTYSSPSTYKRMTSRDYSSPVDVEDDLELLQNGVEQDTSSPSWKLSLPHVLVATIIAFLFGYHIGVVNEPLEIISLDLGFSGNTLAEGLVVSTCLAGAFLGSLVSGWIADEIGRRRAFQLCALPMLIGSSLCATAKTLTGMLLGRFFVGIGLGVGPPVASLYVTEVSPAHVRGTYGSFIQIATCLGIMGALLIGIPVKDIPGWWRYCFWVSAIPASLLALGMLFCAESPHWLYKRGRILEAEAEFEKLLGGSHVKTAIAELAKLDRGDDADSAAAMALQVFAAALPTANSGALYFSVGGMLMFVFIFAVGAGPVPALLLPEIFPSRIRAKAMAFCMAVHWALNFVVGLMFLRLLELLGPQLLYSIFGTFCLMAVAFVKKNVMETKGKSLQEIEIALLPQ